MKSDAKNRSSDPSGRLVSSIDERCEWAARASGGGVLGRQWAEAMHRTCCEGGRADAGWSTWLARHLGFKPGRRKVGRRVWGKRMVYVGRKGV